MSTDTILALYPLLDFGSGYGARPRILLYNKMELLNRLLLPCFYTDYLSGPVPSFGLWQWLRCPTACQQRPEGLEGNNPVRLLWAGAGSKEVGQGVFPMGLCMQI